MAYSCQVVARNASGDTPKSVHWLNMNYGGRNHWYDEGGGHSARGEGRGQEVDEEGWCGAAGGSGESEGKGVASSEGMDGDTGWMEGRG